MTYLADARFKLTSSAVLENVRMQSKRGTDMEYVMNKVCTELLLSFQSALADFSYAPSMSYM
jgi:hypothetical protein